LDTHSGLEYLFLDALFHGEREEVELTVNGLYRASKRCPCTAAIPVRILLSSGS
jgi:hypothetical protein